MKPISHVIASGVTTVVFKALINSWPGAIACFLAGILIDVDHFIDYYQRKSKMCYSLAELENFCSNDRNGKIYLVFHAYEWLVILWGISFFYPHPIFVGIVFGMSVHMVLDQIYNDIYPYAYFWVFRAKYGFDHMVFFREDFVKKYFSTPQSR